MNDVSAPHETALDPELLAAVELARSAVESEAGTDVGQHLGASAEVGGAVTHRFAANLPGYQGWHWAVVLNRAPGFEPTVSEVVLLPGQSALRAPEWVPWSERLKPGDLSPGDLLPTAPDDPRLAPAYTLSDDPAVEAVAFELGMGRVRVMSREGRLDTADRWMIGPGGPDTPMAKQAPAHCGTCGFFLPLAGSLQAAFGVCGNEMSGSDGHVVAVEFGCGAHSESVAPPADTDTGEVYDDSEIELVNLATVPVTVDVRTNVEVIDEPTPVVDSEPVVADSDVPVVDEPEQALFHVEPVSVEVADRDDASGAEADDEAAVAEFVHPDMPQLDFPTSVAGAVEESAASDAGEDAVVEGMGGDDALAQHSDVAATGFEHEPVAHEEG